MKMCSIWQSWLCANKKQVKRWLHIGTAPCDDTIISKILVCCTRMSMRATLHKWFGWKRNILASAKLHRKRVKYLWSPTTIRQVSVYFIDLHALMPHELQPNLFKIHRIWLCRPSVRPSAGIFFFFFHSTKWKWIEYASNIVHVVVCTKWIPIMSNTVKVFR